jgi:hypothetical protein
MQTGAVARAMIAANIDTYEASVRAITEFEWMLARALVHEPARAATAGFADLTRDVTAMQLSTARWILDL